MDIFEKCYAPSLAKELKEAGVYPYFHALQSRQDVEVQMEGKRRIMLGSNNYLGLTIAPDVVEAGIHALERYGTGAAAPGSSTALWRCTWSWRRSWESSCASPASSPLARGISPTWASSAPWWTGTTTSSATGRTTPPSMPGAR